ncbi:MAG: hypothetical protein ACPGSD_17510 [Flavobacteriales bacterium]
MENYQEIIIEWSNSMQIDQVKGNTKDVLYQIYGDHALYGKNTLLYMGISKDVTIRFKTHVKGVFGFVNNKSVRIGTITRGEVPSLEIPESILIANHKPSFNKEFIHDLSPLAKKHKVLLINNGNRGMLQSCCTNFWWVDRK